VVRGRSTQLEAPPTFWEPKPNFGDWFSSEISPSFPAALPRLGQRADARDLYWSDCVSQLSYSVYQERLFDEQRPLFMRHTARSVEPDPRY
jgi:hypothetical protein